MALTAELLTILDNTDEPLSKRLKIANIAFNSSEFSGLNKETYILEWFSNINTQDNVEVWDSLNTCLTSQHSKNLRSSEIRQDVLTNIVTTITKRLKQNVDEDLKNSLIKCALTILKSDIFQQYFKHDMKRYCSFVSVVLINIDDIELLNDIIMGHVLFNKKLIIKTDYSKYFLSNVLNALIDIVIKFPDSMLFEASVKLLQRAIFPFNSKAFINFLTTQFDSEEILKTPLSNNVLEKLTYFYHSDPERANLGFKMIFVSFLSVYTVDTKNIYRFFVAILQVIGFNMNDYMLSALPVNKANYNLDKSLEILAIIFEVISKENIIIQEQINEISFSDCMKSLIISIVRQRLNPNISILKIFKSIIAIDPLTIDFLISDILVVITLSKKQNDVQQLYSDLMISIFDMYLKLHRIHKFCSELLRTMKNALCSINIQKPPIIEFMCEDMEELKFANSVREVFPENVINYFQECITRQSNKQVISIMRTLINSLNEINDEMQTYAQDSNKTLYIQIISDLTCQFLSAVRVAEHTTTEITVNKFLKDMDDLKEILKKYGSALLKMEHNHTLMFSFLNISYIWAEIAILLTFYAPIDNISFKADMGTDSTPSNLTYLHSYLTPEQWSLVSQRIKNFGEQPCKHILQKLIIQKLRAMLLFEKEVNEKVESAIITSYSSNLETSWDIIFSERFIAASFIPKIDNSQLITLADLLITDILKKNNFDILKQHSIIDCRDLVTSIFYVCLSKINNLFKKKRKHNESLNNVKPLSTKLFKNIDADCFIRTEIVNTEKLTELFEDAIEVPQDFKIDEDKFCSFMEILRHIPMCSLSNDVQLTLFLYLLSICVDLKDCKTQNARCIQKCEEYLIGLVENTTSPNILSSEKSHILMNHIMQVINRYKEILLYSINKTLKQNDFIPAFKANINLLVKNIEDNKHLDICIVTLHAISKTAKYKITEDNKKCLNKYKMKICNTLLEYILSNETIIDEKIEAYALILQQYLLQDSDEALAKLTTILPKYIEYTIKNISESNAKGCLHLFEVILMNKSKVQNIQSDFALSAWKSYKELKKNDKYNDNLDKTFILFFEHVSNEQFPVVLKDLLDSVIIFLKEHTLDKLTNQLNIWKIILNSSLNKIKQNYYEDALQVLLQHIIVYIMNNNNDQKLCEAFVNLQISFIANKQITQTSNLIDIYFQTTQILISKEYNHEEFIIAFDISFSILEALTKYRKPLLIDRLPTFLMQFRLFLHKLCVNSNSDDNLTKNEILKISHCGYRMEYLIKCICTLQKDMARIAPYLIADILKEYEKITLYPEVKTHLNNCLYHLVDLCDSYAKTYLLRVLSTASTEIFKNILDNYTKYYKFTGKV